MKWQIELGLGLLAMVAFAAPAMGNTYNLDTSHASVDFQVSHLAISKVKGTFREFSGRFVYDPDEPEVWSAEATIDVTSIDTRNGDRDNHLRSPDFFDAEKFPTMTFKSTGVKLHEKGAAKLLGDLTIRGITRPVVLDLEIRGVVDDPWGNTRAGFAVVGKINRKDFGLTWSKVLETGGLVVGDEVEIMIEAEGVLEK